MPAEVDPRLLRRLDAPLVRALDALLASIAHPQLQVFLVGGVVRDLLRSTWSSPVAGEVSPPDVDVLLAFPRHPAPPVALQQLIDHATTTLAKGGWCPSVRIHGDYGTAQLQLQTGDASQPTVCLDLAVTRQEHYPAPGLNPEVQLIAGPTAVAADLVRRDFSINAMALPLPIGPLLDPFDGQADLDDRLLRFLHGRSVSDDPSRLIRAARYAARLGFSLAPASLRQLGETLAAWPWTREPCPPALGSRLGMELELLFSQEPWVRALQLLQEWGCFRCIDWTGTLQRDHTWQRRLHRASRQQLPLLPAFLLGARQPLQVAGRLQLPISQQRLLEQVVELGRWLLHTAAARRGWTAVDWTAALEGWPGAGGPRRIPAVAMEQAVELAVASGQQPRRPLLQWSRRWRHVQSTRTARQLITAGIARGPALGEELRFLRAQAIKSCDQKPRQTSQHRRATATALGPAGMNHRPGPLNVTLPAERVLFSP